MTSELSPGLVRFIQRAVPTYQAAEVLLFLAARPERDWLPEEIVVGMRPVVIALPAVRQYLALFRTRGVVTGDGERTRYAPATPEIEADVARLIEAYNERPVTLIGAIYRIADASIQSFADAFKLTKE